MKKFCSNKRKISKVFVSQYCKLRMYIIFIYFYCQDITRIQEKLCAECYDPNYVERRTFSLRFFSFDIKLNVKKYIANCESCTCILISKLTVYIKKKKK